MLTAFTAGSKLLRSETGGIGENHDMNAAVDRFLITVEPVKPRFFGNIIPLEYFLIQRFIAILQRLGKHVGQCPKFYLMRCAENVSSSTASASSAADQRDLEFLFLRRVNRTHICRERGQRGASNDGTRLKRLTSI